MPVWSTGQLDVFGLVLEELEKVTGGAGESNGLPPTVPEKDIDSTSG